MTGITNNFERKLFFVFGRHILNVIGVSGFIALLAGGILFFESFSTINLKSKKQYFGRFYATTPKSIEEYHGKDYVKSKELLLDARRNLEKSGKFFYYPQWEEEMKNKDNGYLGCWRNWGGVEETEYLLYKKGKYREYQKKIFKQNLPSKLVRKIEDKEKICKDYRNEFLSRWAYQEKTYKEYKNEVKHKNSKFGKAVRRSTSFLPITWGFGVLSVSSVISTIFSIERNTIKLDPD